MGRGSDFFRFAMVAIVAFLALSLWNAYVKGRDMVFESSESARAGYGYLKDGMDSLLAQDASRAQDYFFKAESSFYELSQTTASLTAQANQMSTQSLYLDTADKLIQGALEVTQLGQDLAKLMKSFSDLPELALSAVGGADTGLIPMLMERKKAFDEIVTLATSLQQKVTTLNDGLLPPELQAKLVTARGQLGKFLAMLLDVDANFETGLTLLGDKVPHRYLVLLQNSNELRATGGFIGSYLLVDMNDGKIAKMEAHDVYESDGQLMELVPAPPGIDQVAKRLYMRDANYSPDFPTSAQKIMWFLEHSRGPSVDTVVAIDQTVVESLLGLTGPVDLPGFSVKVSDKNFSDLISFYTEAKLSDSVTPKQLLFDLIPAFQKKLSALGDLKKLVGLGKNLMAEGHIQAYSSDSKVEGLIVRAGLDGGVVKPEAKTDYLSVVTTSIGGNKSDRYIQTNLRHRAVVSSEGGITDELTIYKTHTFGKAEVTKIENLIARYGLGKLTKETLFFVLGRGPNVDYMRVYVPLGSQIQDVSGIPRSSISISEDLGYTVFGFKNGPINAGASNQIVLKYQLPFKLSVKPTASYKLVVEHQAGAKNMTLKQELQTADSLKVTDSNPPIGLQTPFDRNQTFSSSISEKL